MAGTAMPRSHRGTGVSPVSGWEVRGTSYRRGEPPIHADERHRTSACIRVHRRFQNNCACSISLSFLLSINHASRTKFDQFV